MLLSTLCVCGILAVVVLVIGQKIKEIKERRRLAERIKRWLLEEVRSSAPPGPAVSFDALSEAVLTRDLWVRFFWVCGSGTFLCGLGPGSRSARGWCAGQGSSHQTRRPL